MKRTTKNRLRTYLPRVEGLENRMQPGSILTSGLDLAALGTALDQGPVSLTDGAANALHQAPNLSLGSLHHAAVAGGTVTVAPYQVTHTNTAANTALTQAAGGSANLGFLSQGLAVAKAHLGVSNGTANAAGQARTGSAVNVGQQSHQAPQATQGNLPVAAPHAFQPAAALEPRAVVPVAFHSVDVKVTTETVSGNGQKVSGFWASLATNPATAGSATTALYKVVNGGDGQTAPLYAVGETTDPSGSQDILVVATAAGSTSATLMTIASPNPGDAKGYGIALDSNGNVIIGGTVTDANGNPAAYVASITPDLQTVNWSKSDFGLNGPAVVKGVADSGGSVYFTGSVVVSNKQDIILGKTDEAGNVNFAHFFSFSVATSGNAIGVDPSTGKIDIAGALAGTGVNDPAFYQAPVTGITLSAHYFAGAGSFNGIKVDQGGNAYYAGGIIDTTTSTIDDFIAKVNPDGATLSSDYGGFAWGWAFTINNVPANAPAYDTKADPKGDQVQELTADDNSGNLNTHSHLVFIVGPDGQSSPDSGDGGINGSGDDYGYGIAIDSTAATIYEVGATTSMDFTTNGFQQQYAAGDPLEGWMGASTEP